VKLPDGQRVVSMVVAAEGSVLTATENGYGKRTPITDYPQHGRGGQGVISIQTTERNGKVVGAVLVSNGDEIMLVSNDGTLVRTRASEVSEMGRNTQGVRLISLGEGEKLVAVERVAESNEEGQEEEGAEETPSGE
jgi:DNA gyrase subunit A